MTKMRCAILLMLPGLSAATDALGSNFLEANAKKDGVVSLPSGLQYKVLRAGRLGADTARALPHSPCEIHYEGRVVKEYIISPTSQSFDSTYSVGLPVTVKPKDETKVIKGWAEALQLMVPGDKWELYIPSELAYGAEGMHEKTKGFISGLEIDGNQALIYTFELLTVQYDGGSNELTARQAEKKAEREAKEAAYLKEFLAKPFVGHYEPLPPTPPGQMAQTCPDGRATDASMRSVKWGDGDIEGIDGWVQGQASMAGGALTLVFFFSAEDEASRALSSYVDKLHRKFKHRGLQVVGMHADMQGYRTSDPDGLKVLIDKRRLSFPIADSHAKDGAYEERGYENFNPYREQQVLLKESLWGKIAIPYGYTVPATAIGREGQTERYAVPYLVAMKDCSRIAVAGGKGSSGQAIKQIEEALQPYWPELLWPDDGGGPTNKKLIAPKIPVSVTLMKVWKAWAPHNEQWGMKTKADALNREL